MKISFIKKAKKKQNNKGIAKEGPGVQHCKFNENAGPADGKFRYYCFRTTLRVCLVGVKIIFLENNFL